MKTMLDLGLADTTPHPLNIEVERAEGVWIYKRDGSRIFDAICGIGVSNFSHGHPEIKEALHKQVDTNLHTMVYGEFIHDSNVIASKRLLSMLPDHLNSVYFVNSGAEAIDGALKLAKRVTGRNKLIACKGGYHGNTQGALSVSSNEERKAPFLPLLPNVHFIKFNCVESLEIIDEHTACVLIETVQGDAGVIIPELKWLKALREKCDQSQTLLIFDEIQCGIGRTGKPFAFEHWGISPDILCLGKALGGGVPIGAFVAGKSHMATLSAGPKLGHITTFGGNPLITAGAAAALKLLSETDWDRLERIGSQWEQRLSNHPKVKAVRRIGYFFAVELESEEQATEVILKGLELGVLMFWFLSVPNSFRLSPPLNMSEEDAEIGISLIEKALS